MRAAAPKQPATSCRPARHRPGRRHRHTETSDPPNRRRARPRQGVAPFNALEKVGFWATTAALIIAWDKLL